MKQILEKQRKQVYGACMETCPGGWEWREKKTYLKTEQHMKCYPAK